ncbi:Gp138 family membrane-puncturing spike protein [Entomomonas asaccharolytica]|uniref:Phage protein Gp138 N-terminal domain-containing protein n=1 Tax=Entomomonas asaccharolytica TaxID=2785331 RepID=A0A974NHZ8_9GAMM|nr:Gp138 family membrane-puncturing spike protein [Entomomonas asaccharolytica]QQP86950.1 hypothetical protein JHT90_06810 [Entomomonas asaccharolytica]
MSNYSWDNPSANSQMASATDEALLKVNTIMPARIIEFDDKSQLAKVQPLIDRVMKDGTTQPYPVLASVPVEFPSGGGFTLTFPIKAGDDCELSINQRCIDGYLETGEQRPPEEYRIFHLSDAVARVGIRPKTRPIENFATDGVELRNEAGTAYFRINDKGELVIKAAVIRMVGEVTNEDEEDES